VLVDAGVHTGEERERTYEEEKGDDEIAEHVRMLTARVPSEPVGVLA